MKKIFILVFLILTNLIFTSPYPYYNYAKKEGKAYLVEYMHGYEPRYREIENADYKTFEGLGLYAKDKNHVYYQGEKLEGADANTFDVVFGIQYDGAIAAYSKDKNLVFYKNEIIPTADTETFEVLKGSTYHYFYGKDKNNLYFQKEIIEGINLEGIELIERNNKKYVKNKKNIYYYGYNNDKKKYTLIEIKGADPDTYEEIYYNGRYSYSKDKNHIFYLGKMIKNSDSKTFEILSPEYSRDKNNVYSTFNTLEKLNGVDSVSFEISKSDNRYSKDKNNVYFRGKQIKNVDSKSFTVLKNGYSKDRNAVYYSTDVMTEIKDSDSDSFNVLDYYYAQDKNNLYYHGEPLEKMNIESFKVLGEGYSKDKSSVYFQDFIIQNADVYSFVVLDEGYYYSKDKNNVYHRGHAIENADPDTFRYIGNGQFRDKYYIHKDGNKTKLPN